MNVWLEDTPTCITHRSGVKPSTFASQGDHSSTRARMPVHACKIGQTCKLHNSTHQSIPSQYGIQLNLIITYHHNVYYYKQEQGYFHFRIQCSERQRCWGGNVYRKWVCTNCSGKILALLTDCMSVWQHTACHHLTEHSLESELSLASVFLKDCTWLSNHCSQLQIVN